MNALYALSDLHLGHAANRELLEALPARPHDGLVLAGDLGEKLDHLEWAFRTLGPRWARLYWVPGNHELWTPPSEEPGGLRGLARYQAMVERCRQHGVITPEDPYERFGADGPWICPLFLLYDYSFAPDGLDPAAAVAWARQARIFARDEDLLHPDPWPTRQAWCAARLRHTAERLGSTPGPKVLVNHWPLRRDLVRIPRVPRYLPGAARARPRTGTPASTPCASSRDTSTSRPPTGGTASVSRRSASVIPVSDGSPAPRRP